MQSAVETLSPTRVKLTVEVPFDELKPSLDAAYKNLAGQVKIPGFRQGKVPPRILDQRVGRGAVLAEAVEDAIPRFYSEAVRTNEVTVLGQPEVDVTQFADGDPLIFTAEVDVAPTIELPPYDDLAVTVDDAETVDDKVEDQLASMRDRFATLVGVENRPVQTGDYVSIDLVATVGGEPVEGGETSGMSYEVGSASLIDGLDDAIVGATVDEERTFQTTLVAGEHAGATADVTVTVRSLKEKSLPELDDDFASMASEFDTLEQLRSDLRGRLERVAKLQQGMQARDKVLEALLERVDVPMPEKVLEAEVDYRNHEMQHQLEQAGLTLSAYLEHQGQTQEEHDAEVRTNAVSSMKAQFVLDAIADKEELGVDDAELTETVVRRAQQAGMPPDQYANQIVQSGRLGVLVAEVRRSKALAQVLKSATVTDASGNVIDLESLYDTPAAPVADDEPDPTDEPDGDDT